MLKEQLGGCTGIADWHHTVTKLLTFTSKSRLFQSLWVPPVTVFASQVGMLESRARLLKERQKTRAYESMAITNKDGNERGADELIGTGADDAFTQEPEIAISEREQAL